MREATPPGWKSCKAREKEKEKKGVGGKKEGSMRGQELFQVETGNFLAEREAFQKSLPRQRSQPA